MLVLLFMLEVHIHDYAHLIISVIKSLTDVVPHHLGLLPGVSLTLVCEAPHLLVPPLLRLFGLTDQNHLLIQPLFTFRLVLLTGMLHNHTHTNKQTQNDV